MDTQASSAGEVTARLYNRGPHAICFRGLVNFRDDGRMTWADTDNQVVEWHHDFLAHITHNLCATCGVLP